MTAIELPLPRLSLEARGALPIVTDDALARHTGVRVAFTGRPGGVSEGAYASLNLGSHVDDDPAAVAENRRLLMAALGAPGMPLVVPNQVHGTRLVDVESADAAALAEARALAAEGADGLVVSAPGVAALLCFADCVPVIIVSPTGRFAVVHAGWRGVEASIAPKALAALARLDRREGGPAAPGPGACNVYLGPHIRRECFECGDDVVALFAGRFGKGVAQGRCVDLAAALRADLEAAGASPERIADAGVCTRCHPDEYFSYRASGGVCGRHGAVAFREEG
ncbi:MAG: laccase domain-containing protein [Eggerthellaceae bacterium]|nr:laccase domain-containing protein [Eggerthellaceae bacterium]